MLIFVVCLGNSNPRTQSLTMARFNHSGLQTPPASGQSSPTRSASQPSLHDLGAHMYMPQGSLSGSLMPCTSIPAHLQTSPLLPLGDVSDGKREDVYTELGGRTSRLELSSEKMCFHYMVYFRLCTTICVIHAVLAFSVQYVSKRVGGRTSVDH